MEFGITIPLQRQLKIPAPFYGSERELCYCWELHGIVLQGGRALTAVNASNCYTVVLCNLSAWEWDNYTEAAAQGIRTGFLAEGYTEQETDAYFRKAGAVTVTKTHGRRPVAALNRIMDFLWAAPVETDREAQYQKAHCRFANSNVLRAAGFGNGGGLSAAGVRERLTPLEYLELDMRRLGIVK